MMKVKPEDIKTWATSTRLIDEKELRGSKHQRKIAEIQAIVRRMAENPTAEDMYSLIHMKFVECPYNYTRFVKHCKYLQNRVQWLVKIVLFNEGSNERR